MLARIAMIAITTSSSMRVKAVGLFLFISDHRSSKNTQIVKPQTPNEDPCVGPKTTEYRSKLCQKSSLPLGLSVFSRLSLQLKRECGQRRQLNEQRVLAAHPGYVLALDA